MVFQNLRDRIELKIFLKILNRIDSKKIVDMLEGFGKRAFGIGMTEYLSGIKTKLLDITIEIRKRIGGSDV